MLVTQLTYLVGCIVFMSTFGAGLLKKWYMMEKNYLLKACLIRHTEAVWFQHKNSGYIKILTLCLAFHQLLDLLTPDHVKFYNRLFRFIGPKTV